jgi:hypothetical protein
MAMGAQEGTRSPKPQRTAAQCVHEFETDPHGLAVDDELSFRDPQPQAAPLLPRGGFFAASDPMRCHLQRKAS